MLDSIHVGNNGSLVIIPLPQFRAFLRVFALPLLLTTEYVKQSPAPRSIGRLGGPIRRAGSLCVVGYRWGQNMLDVGSVTLKV